MEDSVQQYKLSYPSVLLAMNLVGEDTNSCLYKQLLQEIKKEAVRRAQKDMTSGQVALHVLALLSSCQDPRHIHALGQTIDLIPILKKKMSEEISHNVISLYQKSLDILTLCVVQEHDDQDTAMAMAKELLSPDRHLDVDSRAMAVLALVCTYSPDTDTEHLMRWALGNVTNGFLDEQESKGMIGNIYSMGLAMQALETSSPFYAPRQWDRAQALEVVQNHSKKYQLPMAIAQVLPGLVGKSYLNAGVLQVPPLPLSSSTAPLTVQYSITNTLRNYFHYSTSVCVPPGSRLLRVLQVARHEKPQIFSSFKTKQFPLGPMVVSIHGLAANKTERTYWQFLSCWSPLQEGGQLGWVGVAAVVGRPGDVGGARPPVLLRLIQLLRELSLLWKRRFRREPTLTENLHP
ncbi:gastric intrinsic factor-like protein [Willisornis vidua]|uniref:Gastric intrinsic factor-like protein n=1 Tax=Willisornis vidua TaxID=1566151 RepID=A0ABQ9D7G6_9PASS|nr:gastric intrinsic factor-like protein [Willisornis vidua]